LKICIVSDSHDRGDLLAAAIEQAKADGAEAVIHCGDVIGGNTLRAAMKLGLPMHVVHGNNLGDPVSMARLATKSNGLVSYHGQDAMLELGGRKIFVTHYPHYGEAMACTGDWDVVCCGHSHEPLIAERPNIKGGTTWLVNPGTVAGLGAPMASFILGCLNELSFELLPTPTFSGQ
jgi:putative phosphoesterase